MLKIRRFRDCLVFNKEIPYLRMMVFILRQGPSPPINVITYINAGWNSIDDSLDTGKHFLTFETKFQTCEHILNVITRTELLTEYVRH